MSPKLVVVFGATGLQGGGVVTKLLETPSSYTLRAVTRNPDGKEGKALAARGVEVVGADLTDYDSVLKAIEGAYAVFGSTLFITMDDYEKAFTNEVEQGKLLANAVLATPTVQHYIWSTLPCYPLYKYDLNGTKTPHFHSKVTVDEYILSLPELAKKTTFLLLAFYVSNLATFNPPRQRKDGTYAWRQPLPPTTYMPLTGDVENNTGIFVAKILERPDLCLPSKYVLANESVWRVDKLLSTWGEMVGKKAEVEEISFKEYVDTCYAGPALGREIGLMMVQFGEYSDPKKSSSSFAKPGFVEVTKEELGVTGLTSIEDTLRGLEWKNVLEYSVDKPYKYQQPI
ncbi:putative NmrA-like family domain-containing protein 1 [Hymenopellis radicata]|nr:putative NmrA-like family domain-containing protein 1 [Hymenopellis radicata]